MRRNKNVNFFTVSSLVATALSVFAFSVTTSQASAASESSRNEERVSSRSRIPKADGSGGKIHTPYSESLGPDIEGMRRKGTYIVTTRTKTGNARVMSSAKQKGIQIGRQFESGVHGFTARLTQQQIREFRKDPNVASVVADKRARALGSQDSPEWHLDRLEGDRDDWRYSFSSTGQGVKIYIVDTGVRTDHTEFAGRIPRGYNAIDPQSGYDDCNGHGTHVAGLAAGMEYGVAKMATIIPVKVLDCSGYGSVSDIMAGLNWIKSDVSAHPGPAVVNMSLGVEADSDQDIAGLENAVQDLITAGITVVAAAGNERTNACSGDGALSPARIENVLTVGGLDYWSYENWFTGESSDKDALWFWSNYGTCVDVYGPSDYLLSAWNSGFNAVNEISGTSMASPLVAGVVAMYLENNVSKTPAEVSTAVLGASKTNLIDDRSYPLSNKASFNNRSLSVVSPPANDVGDSLDLASPFRSFSFYDDDEDEVQEEFTGRSSLYLTTVNATYDAGDPDVATGVRTIWTRFVAPENGELEIFHFSNTTSVGAGLYQANPGGTLTKVGANPNILPITRSITRGQHYYVLFYSIAATGVSFSARLSLDVDAPTNITSSAASAVSSSLPQTITGTTSRATRWNYDEEDRNSVWYKFTVPSGAAKNIIIDTSGSEFDTTVALTSSSGVILNHNDNHGGVTWSRVSYTVQPNVTYWVAVGSNDRSDYGDFTLNIAEATALIPVNNSIDNASLVTSIPGTFAGTNVNADSEFNEENHLYGYSGRGGGCSKAKPMCALYRTDAEATSGSSVWWKFVAPASGRLTVATNSANFKTVLAVYRQYQFGRHFLDNDYCIDVTECGTSPSTVNFSVRQGATYLIAVAGFAEPGFIPSEGIFTLSVSPLTSLNSPPNDMLANATEINVATSGSIAGTVVDATGEEEYGSEQSVWYTFVAPQTGVVSLDADDYSMLLSGYVKKGDRLLRRRVVDLAYSSLLLSVKQGERYYIEAAADLQDSASTFSLIIDGLVVRSPIVNDTPDLAVTIDIRTAGSLSASYEPVRAFSPLADYPTHALYYTVTPEVSGPITFSAQGAWQLGLFTGSEGNFVEIGRTRESEEEDSQVLLTVNLTAGTSYTLVVEGPVSLSWTALAPPVPPAPAPAAPADPEPAPVEAAAPVETPVAPAITVAPAPAVSSPVVSPPSLLPSSAGKQVAIKRAPSKALATDSAVAVKSNKVTVALMVPQSKNKNSQIVKYTIVLKPAKGIAVTKNVTAKAGKKLSTSLSGAKGVKYKLVITGFTKAGKKVVWNGPSITTPKK